MDDGDKVGLASTHIHAKALTWHQQFCKKYGEDNPWELYEREVLKRFDVVFDASMMGLKNLKQDGTVRDYQEKFEALFNRVELSEKHVVSLFLGGLKSEISL